MATEENVKDEYLDLPWNKHGKASLDRVLCIRIGHYERDGTYVITRW